jgi:hypothetical protein
MVMATIYTTCGRYDEAIAEIEYILSLKSNLTVNDFKLNRLYKPLRGKPEFQALMKKYALTANL